MLLRLVRPVERSGSTKAYFVQRIPVDVRARAVGMTLQVPVDGAVVPVTIKSSTHAIRERVIGAKTRQASPAATTSAVMVASLARVDAAITVSVAAAEVAGELVEAFRQRAHRIASGQ